jgi:hypothetical protein
VRDPRHQLPSPFSSQISVMGSRHNHKGGHTAKLKGSRVL